MSGMMVLVLDWFSDIKEYLSAEEQLLFHMISHQHRYITTKNRSNTTLHFQGKKWLGFPCDCPHGAGGWCRGLVQGGGSINLTDFPVNGI